MALACFRQPSGNAMMKQRLVACMDFHELRLAPWGTTLGA